jgi:hypothetical protein
LKGIAIVRSLLRRPPARSVLRSEAAENRSGGAAFEKKKVTIHSRESTRVKARVWRGA